MLGLKVTDIKHSHNWALCNAQLIINIPYAFPHYIQKIMEGFKKDPVGP